MQVEQQEQVVERQVEEDWHEYNNCIVVNMLTADISNFTNWRVIRNGMFSVPPIETLKYLQALPDWDEKWKDAIVESPIGKPQPCEYYPQSSGNIISTAQHLSHFLSTTDCKLEDLDAIFEFGGGYGCLCRLIYRLGFSGEYVSFDLPALINLQKYYLDKTTKGQIAFLPDADEFAKRLTNNFEGKNLFIACWSISESPISLREKVLRAACANTDYILICFQSVHREFNNLDFFAEVARNTDYRWSLTEVPYLVIKNGKHFYLFGERIK